MVIFIFVDILKYFYIIFLEYGIPDIVSTVPAINAEIPLSLDQIAITYVTPILISTNNITIYDNSTGTPLIRQINSGENSKDIVKYSSDGKTIFIDILPTTFNRQNASYYVVIDDNAIKDLKTGQPIMGVYNNIWNFYTGK